MLRFGVISTAKIAQDHVIPAILDAKNCIVNGIASRDISKASAVADRFSIPLRFSSYEEMLDCCYINAIYIPLPTSHHMKWVMKAVHAGKHVLCEKPIALSADDIAKLIAVRDEKKVTIAEGFMITYSPVWKKVRELIALGAIGRLKHVQGVFSYFNRSADDMRNQPGLGGGGLFDIGVYPIMATRFSTGLEPRRVRASIEYDDLFGIDTYSSIQADFGSFDLSFYIATQLAERQLMVFHGTDGYIEVKSPFNANRWGPEEVELTNRSHNESKIYRFQDGRQYKLQAEAFADAVMGLDTEVLSLESSYQNQLFINAVFRAGSSGQWENVL